MGLARTKWKPLLALIAVLVSSILLISLLSSAVFNEAEAVHIDPSSIENATLIVGTHLIHISAMTNTLYDIAVASAGESGQENVYYKSELADGAWFDITTAATLADITTGGIAVSDDLVRALFLTHHTRSDGITYDLRSGAAVNIFNIRSPYDLESMEELFPLKTQYDLTLEMQSGSDYGAMKIALMTAVFKTNVQNSVTAESDASLAALQNYYTVLSENDGGAAEMDAVQSVMDAVDNARRAEVLNLVDNALQSLATTLQTVADTEGDDEDDEGSKGSGSDPDLQAAVNDSLSNVSDSYIESSGKMLSAGVTILSSARYDACLRLIENAKANNHSACDEAVADIIAFDQIQAGTILNKAHEAGLLEDPLIPDATSRFILGLSDGESADYKAAIASNAASAFTANIIKQAGSSLGITRSELEFFIDALSQRMDTASAFSYISGRLSSARGYYDRVPADAFQVMASEAIDAHIDFLTRLSRQLELKLGGNDTDKLLSEKAGLQKDLLSALDKNDLDSAAAIEAKISALDELIDSMPVDESVAAGLSSDLKSQAKAAIQNGDINDLMNNIDALGGLLAANYAAVFPTLEELYADMVKKRDLEGDTSLNGAIDALEGLILDNQAAYEASLSGGMSSDEAGQIILDFLNGTSAAGNFFDDGLLMGLGGEDDLSGLSSHERELIPILALKMYRDATSDNSLDGLLRSRTHRQFDLGNPYVFTAIKSSSAEYLPAKSIAAMRQMRYVWNRNLSEATLARGGTYYFYTTYSNEILSGKSKDDISYMLLPALYQDSLHLPEDYTLETFALWAEYIPTTELGILSCETLEYHAAELFSRFLRASAM